MVFSSLVFLLVFLPIVVFLYHILTKWFNGRLAILSLFIASLIYYAYWKVENIWIIIASIIFNYLFGKLIKNTKNNKGRKIYFMIAILADLGFLFYFKYTDFFISTVNLTFNSNIPLTKIILPIGISFFTFQQIAYISDIYTKKFPIGKESFLDYCLFVCFFPQLVAGPIVHHNEMMPQFADTNNRKRNYQNIYLALIMLSIGLAKKVLISDNLSPIVHHAFDVTKSLSFLEALFGSIAYSMQLYFDFSGYSDMAVGCALFFNIKLPFNFNSPYKSKSIREFWRRWHITLSIWLRDYLYIPLGGNRKGKGRTYLNLFITMTLGGLWHGAAFTFVIWGMLHGLALAINRLWNEVINKFNILNFTKTKKYNFISWLFTFLFVNFAFIIFRAKDLICIQKFLDAFLGRNMFFVSNNFKNAVTLATKFQTFYLVVILLLFAFFIAIFAKNSIYMYENKDRKCVFVLGILCLLISMFCLIFPDNTQEFIYFQF